MPSDTPDETGRTSPWSEVSPPVMTPSRSSSPIDDEKEFTLAVSEPAEIESSEGNIPTQPELDVSSGPISESRVEEKLQEDLNDEESNISKAKETEGNNEKEGEINGVGEAEDKPQEEEKFEEEKCEEEKCEEEKCEEEKGGGEVQDEENKKGEDEEKAEVKKEKKLKRVKKEWTTPLVKHIDPELIDDESPSRLEWLRQKRENGEKNVIMDEIMSMIGIEKVKAHFLWAKERAETAKRWKEDMRNINFDLVLHGGDGTGKKRIAQLYAELLYSIGAVCRRRFLVENKQCITEKNKKNHATVIFFRNSERFESTDAMKAVMGIVNKRKDKVVIILAFRAHSDDLEASLAATSDSRRRFCNRIVIDTYGEVEIMQFLSRLLEERTGFETKAVAETFLRILAHEVLKQRKASGSNFKNANAIAELFYKKLDDIFNRKKQRLELEWMRWTKANTPDDQDLEAIKPKDVFTLEDIFEPEPSSLRSKSKAWKELQQMVGLDSAKKEISDLLNLIDFNRQCQQQGRQGIAMPLNLCIIGAPGVGKTTIAKLYAETLAEGGLLSEGHIIVKTASELMGDDSEGSKEYTTTALEEAEGGILIIDDAHVLYEDCPDGQGTDSYRQGIIDALAANVSGEPDEDRSVILCGYTEEMERMVLSANQGLQRSFPFEYAIKLDSYTEDELCQILDMVMTERNDVAASEQGLKIAKCILGRMRTGLKFSNATAVQNLLFQAKSRRMRRLRNARIGFAEMQQYKLEAEDFDPDWERWFSSNESNKNLFEGFVGFEQISGQFERYQKIANSMRRRAIDPRPHIPSGFVFKGPPGTGKTSAAKKVGTIFYDLGFLPSDEVVVCSVTDFIGQYTGQTGPKVRRVFEGALGKVLLIDEAYQLNQDSNYHGQALAEIVDIMTRPKYAGNMVVILAGYDDDMESLLGANSGLRSRFPTIVKFTSMTTENCLRHLIQCLNKLKIQILETTVDHEQRTAVLEVFGRLRDTGEWANGRDVETLAQRIIGHVFVKASEVEDGDEAGDEAGELVVSFEEVRQYLELMLEERGGEL